MIPFLALGYVAGTWAHKKMDSHQFNLLIYAQLAVQVCGTNIGKQL